MDIQTVINTATGYGAVIASRLRQSNPAVSRPREAIPGLDCFAPKGGSQ
jgi:hypothetical protein